MKYVPTGKPRGRPKGSTNTQDSVRSSSTPNLLTHNDPHLELPSISAIEAELERRRYNQLDKWFPDSGPHARHLYKKHLEFFAATKDHREVLQIGANRVGKTIAGAYSSVLHATGLYPKWWPGRRFEEPTIGWVLNRSSTDVRDINQLEIMGPHGQYGSGMLPASLITDLKARPNVPAGLSIVYVKHVSGGISTMYFKSYDQGREAYQGRAVHWIWADEEIPYDIYSECLLRTMTTEGIIYCTYTPLHGLTRVTVDFLKNRVNVNELPIKFSHHERERVVGNGL